ncbi:Gfo/Idh/MocA family protein [Candidatus Cyanaurora vandensis]|uniref:Gfo/Idh/MocA family protein n=1 Tax=Candidatus Cyanaurora vandensis TaxID=2714958 RepID=UPI00257D4FA3|nr:Gfo/Idh/MocA family oxidoreductase [Candidatus Cyanaurora vandensis]
MAKLRLGVIGIGWWATAVHVPALRQAGAEVVAISRRDPVRLAVAQQALGVPQAYTDWRELLAQPLDGVIVSTAHHAHMEPTLAALAQGLPVLVEKPLALTSSDSQRMVSAAEQAGQLLMVGYNARCLGLFRTVQQALAQGLIGQVRQVNLVFSDNYRWFWEAERVPPAMTAMLRASGVPEGLMGDGSLDQYWRRQPEQMGGGMFADIGSHWVDLALWLGGAPAVTVMALTERAGLAVDCFVTAQARLANGVLVSLTAGAGVAGKSQRQLTVLGDQGLLTSTWSSWDMTEVQVQQKGTITALTTQFSDLTPAAAFVQALRGGPNLAPAQQAAHAVAFTEACYRSADSGALIHLS